MAKQRLSKLQKTILVVLQEQDRAEYKSTKQNLKKGVPIPQFPWCLKKGTKPPYLYKIRPTYCTLNEPFPMIPFGATIAPGIKLSTSQLVKKSGPSFSVSFSRSVKSLVAKGLVETLETRSWAKKHQVSRIALTKEGQKVLKLISVQCKT